MKVFSVDEGDTLFDFDINNSGQVSCLLRDGNGNAFVKLGEERLPLPSEWQDLVVGIRWRDHSQCFVWATSYPTEGHPSSVGVVDKKKAYKIKLSTPMFVFTSADWVICSDSEVVVSEEMMRGNPRIFTVYSTVDLNICFSFGDIYDVSTGEVYFSQVEIGVISKYQQKFWFVADDTGHLWDVSLPDRVYRRTKINIPLSNIRCIACDQRYCYLITESNKTFMAHIYSGESCSVVASVPLETIIGRNIDGIIGAAENHIWRGHEGSISIAANGIVENFSISRYTR
jgi:hypothetical protein